MLLRTLTQKGDSMPRPNTRILMLVALVGMYSMVGHATEPSPTVSVQAENLLRESLAGAEGKEVIISRVRFPPHTELPWHWHPGEEFFFVIEGSMTLKRRGEADVVAAQGGVQKIAPQVIHTGRTGEQGAELVIFRLHAAGEPERYLVD